jgi:PAS domain S-box-containing protein
MGKQVHAALTSCQDVILDSINEGVFTVDSDWRITSFNRAAQKITGIKRKDAIGHHCSEVFRASICENNCAIKKALTTGGGDREFERSHHQRVR